MNEPGRDIDAICSSLAAAGYAIKFRGFSAIDLYMRLPALPYLWAETNADIAVLARLIENLRFPGVEIADGASDSPEGTCYFRCIETEDQNKYSYPLLSFSYDCQTGHFLDPHEVYPLLRSMSLKNLRESREKREWFLEEGETAIPAETNLTLDIDGSINDRYRIIMDTALLMARYGLKAGNAITGFLEKCPPGPPPGPEMQRIFLSCLLVSARPDFGFNLLKRSGFLHELWPELAAFDDVDHSKEFHPEGNVWNHTMETFRHRKPVGNGAFDLRLSLGLLLHDAGKPISASFGNHRFDGHAELGARAASRFLERLGFEPSLVGDIFYLVKNHMLPAALKRLPLTKTAEIMASPLFPTLMELYRCDESSSFKGLDGYYENSAAYKAYLKNVKNPYRSADGKKMGKYSMI